MNHLGNHKYYVFPTAADHERVIDLDTLINSPINFCSTLGLRAWRDQRAASWTYMALRFWRGGPALDRPE